MNLPLDFDSAERWSRIVKIALTIAAVYAITVAGFFVKGNYLGGAIWPPLVQRSVEAWGWRSTYIGMGIICAVAIAALALLEARGQTHS